MADKLTSPETTSGDRAPKKQTRNQDSRWIKGLTWFGQLIVPLLLGSFLFSGILEGYKSSLGDKKDIIDSYYRPMRALHALCAMRNQQLANQYGELAGLYKLQFDELTHMFTHPGVSSSAGYEVIPRTIASVNNELAKSTKELNETVRQCHVDLYIKYEELALVTGTYEKFKRLASSWKKKLEPIEEQLQVEKGPYLAAANTDEMMKLLRELATVQSDSSLDKEETLGKFKIYATSTVELNHLLMKAERQRFEVEQAFFRSARNLFAREISARQSKGFFSYLF